MGEAESSGNIAVAEQGKPRSVDIDDPQFRDPSRQDKQTYNWYDISDVTGSRIVDFMEQARTNKWDRAGGMTTDGGRVETRLNEEGREGENIKVIVFGNQNGPVEQVKISLRKSEGSYPEVFLSGQALGHFKEFMKNPTEDSE